MGLRELVAAPVDWLLIAQKSIDQGEGRIEVLVIRAPAVGSLVTPKLLERITRLLSNAFPLNREVYECPSRSVSSVPQAWDQDRVPVRVAEASFENAKDDRGGHVADARMPNDVGDEIEDDGHPVRVAGPTEHPSNAKGIRDESSPVDFLFPEDQGYVLTQNDLQCFTLFVGSGDDAWLAFGGCSWLKVISAGISRREGAEDFPDSIGKTPTKDCQERWSDCADDDKDNTEDLGADDGD